MNRTGDGVKLFWIDTDGNREPYGSIPPGERRVQQTFGGHVWLVTKSDGSVVAVFQARNDPAEAIIDGGATTRESTKPPAPRTGGRTVPGMAADAGEASPDGRWTAFVRDNNLWLRDTQTKAEHSLTHDGTSADTYHRDVLRDQAIGMDYEKPDAPPAEPGRVLVAGLETAGGHADAHRAAADSVSWWNRPPKTNYSLRCSHTRT